MRNHHVIVVAAAAVFVVTSSACSYDDGGDLTMGSMINANAPPSAEEAIHNVCPQGATTFGIDVSKWQGDINWGAVAGDGVKFAIIRVSDGTGYMDGKYDQNWAGARDNGILRGTYQFFRSDDDPIAQADILISRMGPLQPGDLPPVADVESTDGVSNATRAARLHAWLDHVEAAVGVRPIIYTGGYFWQDNVGEDFSGYPLWHAGYTGGDCPSTIANQWPDWAFWQFTSSGSINGISGNVDENRYNGDLAGLQDFANANQAPRGYLDDATCDAGAVGWAQDLDAADAPIAVHVYIDGEAGSGAHGFPTTAANHRDDLCTAIGSCEHGFALPIPNAYRDGAAHTVFAYGIDSAGGNNPQLSGSGAKSFTCAPPAMPIDALKGVLRHVTSPDAMAAWQMSFDDVAAEPADVVAAYAQTDAWVDAPRTIRADGEPAVYLVDRDGSLRHVVSPDSMTAWHLSFDAIEILAPYDVHAMTLGPDLPATPFLLRAAGDPAVYMLDVAVAVEPPPLVGEGEGEGEDSVVGEGEGADGNEGAVVGDGGDGGAGGADVEGDPNPRPQQLGDVSAAGGCSAVGGGDGGVVAIVAVIGLAVVTPIRRRRTILRGRDRDAQ